MDIGCPYLKKVFFVIESWLTELSNQPAEGVLMAKSVKFELDVKGMAKKLGWTEEHVLRCLYWEPKPELSLEYYVAQLQSQRVGADVDRYAFLVASYFVKRL